MTDSIELEAPPSLPKVFARAVASSRGRNGKGPLPDLQVVRRGVAIDPSQLADYDHVCGFTLRDEVPSTYLHNLVFPLQVSLFADKRYPYPLVGSVHLDNTLTQHRPVLIGEQLDLSTHATNARPHKRGVQVDVVSRAHVGDELVWEGLATYLYRGQRIDGNLPERPQELRGPREVSERDTSGELRGVQDEAPDGPGMVWRLPGNLGRRFAAVSGDVNPIHMNSVTAKAMGFPTTIVHGMWSQARMLGAIENRLPAAYRAEMSFRKAVLIPGTVRLVARERPGAWQLALRENRRSTVLVRGEVSPIS
ncbi:MaoC/PaaZ C-terminal domain-containing protein [Flexivirga oryzae]|uniref:Acyl dehydratase n=1 Tax=Flexivirga oryzae TaxID=1794944 RepID=A0A839NGG4_9MICO|nr:MaoC/PaaZ C-terminal domain-containing protein [Flexivirga oryzae]MBB2894225.1 acyl dehydratase [Flexivirga oryzae]